MKLNNTEWKIKKVTGTNGIAVPKDYNSGYFTTEPDSIKARPLSEFTHIDIQINKVSGVDVPELIPNSIKYRDEIRWNNDNQVGKPKHALTGHFHRYGKKPDSPVELVRWDNLVPCFPVTIVSKELISGSDIRYIESPSNSDTGEELQSKWYDGVALTSSTIPYTLTTQGGYNLLLTYVVYGYNLAIYDPHASNSLNALIINPANPRQRNVINKDYFRIYQGVTIAYDSLSWSMLSVMLKDAPFDNPVTSLLVGL